ncbi:MAG: translation elongation factor Ts [Minisyncoccus archaeiphilus]|uniref:translation elongation factor Ts n=1 Tax=Minisyncoccus archaeiphilus TaxID=3238481 RepID=UPI0009C697B7|nr:MAG: Elongation factor Ts [Parcubacteria group bacterium ADurb.Bin216]GMX59835.1 MAG: translation elongation factor Ts [Candidatus Parcubacteria bacterium]
MADLELVKKLREETGISLNDCKNALDEAGNDIEKAKEVLKKRGQAVAQKKVDREVGAGIIDTYIHSTKRLGVMIELACETDFVARGDDFANLGHEICLQIASMKPSFVKEEDVPEEVMQKERAIFEAQAEEMNKPKEIMDGIINGKLEKYKKGICLLSQPWVKDNTKTIHELVNETIAKTGENIVIKRFTMYEF